MSEINFLTVRGQQSLSNELALLLFNLDKSFFPTPWSLRAWNTLNEQNSLLVIMYCGETIIGFCLFDTSPADSFAHLLKILVEPEWKMQGLAKKLLNHAIDQLSKEHCSHLFLEVEENNHAARGLYTSLGFTEIHLKKDFYGLNRNAVIMTRG